MNMNDYVDVAERIAQLKEAYPEASLQPYNPNKPYDIVQVEGKTYVVYTAACYRDPFDQRPGVAVAWEQIPGKGMTAGSELMICETSAWGRAIVAAMKTATKRIASKQEVVAAKNRQSWAVTPKESLDSELLSRPTEPVTPTKAIYGQPGSKSALMERIMRHQFVEEKKPDDNPIPMSVDQATVGHQPSTGRMRWPTPTYSTKPSTTCQQRWQRSADCVSSPTPPRSTHPAFSWMHRRGSRGTEPVGRSL